MKTFKQFIREDLDAFVRRVDPKRRIGQTTDFGRNMQSYQHMPNFRGGSGSNTGDDVRRSVKKGTYNPKHLQGQVTSKEVFGGTRKFASQYSAPRDTNRIFYKDPDTHRSTVVFNQKDKQRVQNQRSVETLLPKNRFKETGSFEGEYHSQKPGRQTRQHPITNAEKHMQRSGVDVRYVPSLKAHAKELDKKKKGYSIEGEVTD
jgi:hypothetical protein